MICVFGRPLHVGLLSEFSVVKLHSQHTVTELCRIGLTVQTHPNYQYRPFWLAGEWKHDVLLAQLYLR